MAPPALPRFQPRPAMPPAERLLAGALVALAGVVFRDHLPGIGATMVAAADAPRRPPPDDKAEVAELRPLYASIVAGVPEGGAPPAWLQAIHLRRLAAPGGTGADASGSPTTAALRRAADAAATDVYVGTMLAGQDSTLTRWRRRGGEPLAVWVQEPPAGVDSLGQLAGYVRAAFRVWNETATGVPFTIVGDSTTADVHVTWAPRLGDPNGEPVRSRNGVPGAPSTPAAPVRVGHTIRLADGDGWVRAAHVVLLASPDLASVQNAALHEAGHVLGLGHSPTRGDQMAAITDGRHYRLTDADRESARVLYALPPGRVRDE